MAMKRVALISTVVVASALAFFPLKAALTTQDKAEMHEVIREYLIQNPEVIKDALEALQKKEVAAQEQETVETIMEEYESIFHSKSPSFEPETPVVTLVEFFDYQCRYCKRMGGIITEAVKQNPDLRIVYKDLPLLGGNSITAAKAALASRKQEKYLEYHKALMSYQNQLDEAKIFELATELGLDIERLKLDMEAPDIEDELKQNFKLAGELGVRGIPAMIVGPHDKNSPKKPVFIPGSTSADKLQVLIDNARL